MLIGERRLTSWLCDLAVHAAGPDKVHASGSVLSRRAYSERQIAQAIKQLVQDSVALVLLVSPITLSARGANQWTELAYADAFEVTTFILLHHLEFKDLKSQEEGVPLLLLAGQCTPAAEWRKVIEDIRSLLRNTRA